MTMNGLRIYLFGRFEVWRGEQVLVNLDSRKAQELFCYLLLYRDRPHSRETLANMLWPTSAAAQSMKNLRNALWELQNFLDSGAQTEHDDILVADRDWISLNLEVNFWLDVAEFERAYAHIQGKPGPKLDEYEIETCKSALELYKGDLLEGWYQDWYLFERERLQQIYLVMLEKLMAYCEAQGDYEAGLDYGTRALRCDVAHERVHRRLMRLHYLTGNRTAALRQYERCVTFLRQELDVAPSMSTVALHKQIRSGSLPSSDEKPVWGDKMTFEGIFPILLQVYQYLKQLQTVFSEAQHPLLEALQTLGLILED